MTIPEAVALPTREAAVARVRRYLAMRDAKPLRQLDDVIHAVHAGEWEGILRLSDIRAMSAALSEIRTAERERAAQIASDFTMKPDARIHPDIPWEKTSEKAKMIAHTTAQQIAHAIRSPDQTAEETT